MSPTAAASDSNPAWRSRIAVVLGVVVLGLLAEHVAHSWEQPAWIPIADLAIGWLMVGCGLAATSMWPRQSAGVRLILAGYLWFVGTYMAADDPRLSAFGFAFGGYYDPVLVLLALSFPDRWPTGRAARWALGLVAGLYATQSAARLILTAPTAFGVTLVDPELAFAAVVRVDILRAAAVVLCGLIAIRAVIRLAAARRRDTGLVLLAGAASALAGGWSAWYAMTVVGLAPVLDVDVAVVAAWTFNVVRLVVPMAILAGVLRAHTSRAAMATAVAAFRDSATTVALRSALATAMRDPELGILVWDGERDRYVGADQQELASAEADRLAAAPHPVVARVDGDGGARLAIIRLTHASTDEALFDAGVALTRLVVENEQLAGQIRDQLEEVRASRTRIVEAAEEERRRIERDLHDGLQQRMVTLALQLQSTGPRFVDREATLRRGAEEVLEILEDVRELARGIHPPVLVQAGLAAAIRAVADRSPIPAELGLTLTGAGSAAAQATAYFVVSEALANSAKHAAAASTVWVLADDTGGRLRVVVEDDGPGGADASGHGLRGLDDRVAALGGRFQVGPRPNGGTRVEAEIPIA